MDRFVEIRFEGRCDQFFTVNYRVLNSSRHVIEGGEGTLPPCPELVASIKNWQTAYHADVRQARLESLEISITNASDINHKEIASKLKTTLNNWLNSSEFLPVKDRLSAGLNPDQVILIGFDISDSSLKYAPWHLWSLFEQFPKADFTLLRPNFSKVNDVSFRRLKLNILAIIGDSRKINTEEDKTILRNLPYIHNPEILGEPSKEQVKDILWGSMSVDVLFFAGHGKKEQDKGKICINSSYSLGIGEIKSALRKRIKQGLQLAIFNSCDGLELGEEIADLHIPQVFVMKEAVPDEIAQRFLKDFLQEFSQGVPLVQALRQTRDKLADWDQEYPYASWLPVLYCNPTEPLMQWPKPNFAQRYPWQTVLAASCLVGLLGLGVGVAYTLQKDQSQAIVVPANTTQANVTQPETKLSKTYSDKSYGIADLKYPDGWVLQKEQDGFSGDVLQLLLSDNRDVAVSLKIRNPLDQSLTLDKLKEKTLERFKTSCIDSCSDFKIIKKEEEITVAQRKGYTMTFSTNQEGKIYKKTAFFTLKNDKVYMMIYSAPEELFNKHESVVKAIIESLQLSD